MSYYIYTGPAIICVPALIESNYKIYGVCTKCHTPDELKKTRGISKDSTTNTEVPVHPEKLKTARFCTICGGALVDMYGTEKTMPSADDITEAVDEALYVPAIHDSSKCFKGSIILAPNKDRKPPFKFETEVDSSIQIITPDLVEQSIAWFKQAFAREIKIVEDTYEQKNTNIQFVNLISYS